VLLSAARVLSIIPRVKTADVSKTPFSYKDGLPMLLPSVLRHNLWY
jgi:hypothetical protein